MSIASAGQGLRWETRRRHRAGTHSKSCAVWMNCPSMVGYRGNAENTGACRRQESACSRTMLQALCNLHNQWSCQCAA